MRSSHNPHAHFFSSLKQIEKRLKLENNTSLPSTTPYPPPPYPPPPESNYIATESLSSPIYLNFNQPTTTNGSTLEESGPPQEFLSNILDFPSTHEEDPSQSSRSQNPETINDDENNGVDDIELLMQLLGLSDCKDEEQEGVRLDLNSQCDDGFYGNIVKVKGPKCKKEVERLEGWIKHFMNEGDNKEPLRLAHLLLAKAVLVSDNSDGLGGFQFPSTVDEFLQNDPPPN